MKNSPLNLKHLLKYIFALALLAGVNFTGVYAQEQYTTSGASLIIRMFLNDTPVKISSNKLLILLDYETGNMMMKQEIAGLSSDNPIIQKKLKSKTNGYIRFEGKLGIDYVNTLGHPPLDFPVEGTLYPENYHILGSGHLVHRVHGTSSVCLLSMNFQLEVDKLFPDSKIEGLSNEIYIQVTQSLLARKNER